MVFTARHEKNGFKVNCYSSLRELLDFYQVKGRDYIRYVHQDDEFIGIVDYGVWKPVPVEPELPYVFVYPGGSKSTISGKLTSTSLVIKRDDEDAIKSGHALARIVQNDVHVLRANKTELTKVTSNCLELIAIIKYEPSTTTERF